MDALHAAYYAELVDLPHFLAHAWHLAHSVPIVTGPSQAEVDALHAAYYAELVDLFRRYSHLHPHFDGAQLVLAYD